MKLKKNILLGLIIITGIVISFSVFTFAKYVSNTVWNYYLKSHGFYFSSNHLTDNGKKNEITNWNEESVTFNLKNSASANVTNYDIKYKVFCAVKGAASNHVQCQLNGSGSNNQTGTLSASTKCVNKTSDGENVDNFEKQECELAGYTWESQEALKDIYFDIVSVDPEYEIKDVTVTITVTSTSPYKKVLSGDFLLIKNPTPVNIFNLNYENYENYDHLIITNTYKQNKCLKVTWDSNKLLVDLDKTIYPKYKTDSSDYINEIIFSLETGNSADFKFYRKDFEAVYNAQEFTVTESEECE